jgi:hypothetical protein
MLIALLRCVCGSRSVPGAMYSTQLQPSSWNVGTHIACSMQLLCCNDRLPGHCLYQLDWHASTTMPLTSPPQQQQRTLTAEQACCCHLPTAPQGLEALLPEQERAGLLMAWQRDRHCWHQYFLTYTAGIHRLCLREEGEVTNVEHGFKYYGTRAAGRDEAGSAAAGKAAAGGTRR